MRTGTYRVTLIGSMLSSLLVGLHLPLLHEMIEHGAPPQWGPLSMTLLLAVGSVAGAWKLLRVPMR